VSVTQAVNPYRFPSPIKEPHLFFGRDQQLRDVLESIDRRECVSIIGERRAGKTSLMQQALQPHVWDHYIRDRQCLAVHLNAEILPQDEEGFFREVLYALGNQYPDLPAMPAAGPPYQRAMRRALESLRPRRLAIFIDEFEYISRCEAFSPDFFVFLRGLSFDYDISFIISTRTRLFECCSHEVVTSPFPNIFKTVRLGPFSKDEFDTFIERTSAIGGCPMGEVKGQIEQLAGRFPFLMQMACWHYFRAWERRGDFAEGMHEVVRQRFCDEAHAHFAAVWERYLSDEERSVILGALRGGQLVRPHVAWRLEDKGYMANDHVIPTSFAEWIRREYLEKGDLVGSGDPGERLAVPDVGIWVDDEAGAVYLDGERLDPPLTNKQYALAKLLFENRTKVCTPYMIVTAVYSEDHIPEVDDQRIHQLVSRVRKRLDPGGKPWRNVLTVHGRGFTLGPRTERAG
jgi:eukaryotic-like serine/threonine-protein kinase